MDADRWRRTDELFAAALDLPVEEREGFLTAECGEDGALRAAVERLLAADSQAEQFLAAPAVLDLAAQEALEADAAAGLRLGPYTLLHRLGQGGMGTVYLASRDDGAYDRQVAVKLLRAGADAFRVNMSHGDHETHAQTIAAIRDRTHWNIQNIQPKDPVTLGLCSQRELDAIVAKAMADTANFLKEQGRITAVAEGQTWISATVPAGGDSILVIVPRSLTGPVVGASPGGRGATTGGDPSAWADSIREVEGFFARYLH